MPSYRLLFAAVLLFAAAGSAEAREPRWRTFRTFPQGRATAPAPRNRLPRYEGDWRYPYNALYPRYIGGFHYRTFNQFGYPPGDIGLRGTAW